MAQESDPFLQAEQRARDLVETLEQLTEEVQSYQTATGDLHEARDAVAHLTTSMQPIAEATHDLLKTARSVGGPAIMDAVASLSQRTETQHAAVKSDAAELQANHETTHSKIAGIDKVTREHTEQLGSQINKAQSTISSMAKATLESTEALRLQIEGVKRVATTAAILAAVAAAVAVIGLLVP